MRRSASLLVAVLIAGCGTTVPVTSQVTAGGRLTAEGQQRAPGAAPVVPGTAPDGTTGAPVSSVPTAAASRPPDLPLLPPASGSGIPMSGQGWDRSNVHVGVITNSDIQRVATTLGVESLDSGDQRADAEAMIAHLNSKGGLFGRRVVGVYFDVKTSDNRETSAQATCDYFTQDHPVVLVIDGAVQNDTPSFRACMARRHTLVFGAGAQPFDDKVFEELAGGYYLLPYPSWSRLAPALVDRLVSQGYFTGWDAVAGGPGTAPVRIGLLALDSPILRRVIAIVTRELTRRGHPPYEAFFATDQASMQAAVLRFRSDGITHVLSTDQFLFLFMNNAESQRYRPRYAISTPNAPGLLLQGTVPPAQMAGAVGLGFFPMLDVDARRDPGTIPTAECRSAYAKHGVSYPPEKRFAQAYAWLFCDAFRILALSATSTGGLSQAHLRAGLVRYGGRVPSSFTFVNGLGPAQPTMPGAGVDLRWDPSCECLTYVGGTHPL